MHWLLVYFIMELITVGDAAKKLGLSVDTIRRWEKMGLLRANRDKNNYRLFDLEEIKAIKKKISGQDKTRKFGMITADQPSAYKVIDLFSGAGGTALGLHNAGFQHEMLVEIDKDAALTLKNNMSKWNVVHEDISKVDFKGIKADVIEGGFPCQAFSYAGKKMGFEDTRGTLFFEFARAIGEVRPKIAIGENVKGLLRHDNGRTLKTMISALEELGYKATFKILRSQYLDVPQKRERLIIMAIRQDINLPFVFPKEKDYLLTLRDALVNVPNSAGQSYPESKKKVLSLVPPGGYWRDLPLDIQKEYMGASYFQGGGKTGMARRLSWDEPSLTLTTSPAQKQTERCHPEFTRPLTVREYARIQTFPDHWVFAGSTASQYKQIGNAVPVNMAYHLGSAVRAMLENTYNTEDFVVTKDAANEQSIFEGLKFSPQLQLPMFG